MPGWITGRLREKISEGITGRIHWEIPGVISADKVRN